MKEKGVWKNRALKIDDKLSAKKDGEKWRRGHTQEGMGRKFNLE